MHTRILQLASALAMLGLLSTCSAPMPPGAPEPTSQAQSLPTTTPPDRIIADAVVLPARSVDISFAVGGTVAGVLVDEGDTVAANAPLAQLDTGNLALQVAQRQASLAEAQASYDKIQAGATPEEIAAQQAIVRNAEANLDRARTGNVTAADIAGAQAQLRQAEAALAALRNPSTGDLRAAEAQVQQAEAALQSTRDSASQAKTSSELAMQRAADALTQAQASYATAKSNWAYVQDTGADPANPKIVDSSGKTRKNKLNDVQERQYYEAFVQAEAAMHSAEKALADAQVAFEQARKSEVTSIQNAESQLAEARARLEGLTNPDSNAIARQQASVDQARANLAKIRQGGSPADVAAAQASVAQEAATLAGLTVPPRAVDLAEAQGRIAQARAALAQAERDLDQATLRAPFAGTIAVRNLEVGQRVGGGASDAAPFVLADFEAWKIVTTNLGEREIARVQIGAPARITFDALPDLGLAGKVTAIHPRGVDQYGDITYTVTVTPDTRDERLRWNMSAAVSITAQTP